MVRSRQQFVWVLAVCVAVVAQATPQAVCLACDQPCCANRASRGGPTTTQSGVVPAGHCPLCTVAADLRLAKTNERPCRGASSRRLPMLTRLPHRQLYRHGCRRSLASAGSTWRPHSPCRSARHGFYLACGGTESTAEPCLAVSLWTSAAERARELAFPRFHIGTWIDRFRFQIQGRFP